MSFAARSVSIPPRYCGPAGSGNGGYVCGRIAACVPAAGPVEVTLRRPPPLATPMTVDRDGDAALRVRTDGTLIAEAVPVDAAFEVPSPVSLAQALAAAGRAHYYADPVYPTCFVCGPDREPGDGLRIFPGRVAGKRLWAAPWTPDPSVTDADGSVRPEVVWAALDCPSGIAAAEAAELAADTAILLGRMTATVAGTPRAGDPCRVIAWPDGRDGRKLTARSALLGPGGEVLAAAQAVWLTVARPGKSNN